MTLLVIIVAGILIALGLSKAGTPCGCFFQFGRTSILFPWLPHLAQTTCVLEVRNFGVRRVTRTSPSSSISVGQRGRSLSRFTLDDLPSLERQGISLFLHFASARRQNPWHFNLGRGGPVGARLRIIV